MKEILTAMYEILDAKKAINVRILDVSRISTFTNYFVICSGANSKHIQILADELLSKLGQQGRKPSHLEGYQNAEWILMDYFDFIVHIFALEARDFYELEKLWADGKVVDVRSYAQ